MGESVNLERLLCRFKSDNGEALTDLLDLPVSVNVTQLQQMCNSLLQQDQETPYVFYINDIEVTSTLNETLKKLNFNSEDVIDIIYQQQAVFRVKSITRCTSSLPGHSEAVISVSFSPNSKNMASGSGDTTVRFWDLSTQTPHYSCTGHKNWVLCVTWSPDGRRLASGDKNGQIIIWDPESGTQCGKTMTYHKQWITHLAWEPYHLDPSCRRLASASKDGDVRIWDTILGQTLFILSSHTKSVTCVKWGGAGLLYSSSQDTTIKVWRSSDGVLCRTLTGHAHWVNTLAVNTDWVLRTGPFDPMTHPSSLKQFSSSELQKLAQDRYDSVCQRGEERLVSGSDDFTLYLWKPETDTKPLARLTGHQQLVNDVKFSPDGKLLASASFDKSIKLWEAKSGKFMGALKGHVQAAYVIAWSPDSRLLLSASADSTLKVWNVKGRKLEIELPGHADEIYAIDWAPDGSFVASGGKDRQIRLWQH